MARRDFDLTIERLPRYQPFNWIRLLFDYINDMLAEALPTAGTAGQSSLYNDTLAAAGAISTSTRVTNLALAGAGAVTLAAPGAGDLGRMKIIEMTADNGDVTLALTNVEGQSSGTTATFNDVTDTLVLVARSNKWVVIKERGITLS